MGTKITLAQARAQQRYAWLVIYCASTPAQAAGCHHAGEMSLLHAIVLWGPDRRLDEPEFQLLARGRDAMIAAISAYNNPTLRWKAETFIVNAIIAWTYLHHAYFTKAKVDFTYKDKTGPVLLPNGKPKLWELSKCISVNACPLSTPAKRNLEYLIEIRNEIEHRKSENIDAFVLSKMQACAINFNRYIVELFGAGFSLSPEHGLAIQLAQISPLQHEALKGNQGLPAIIAAVNKIVEEPLTQGDYDSLEYAYRVFVMPKTINNKSKADEAVTLLPPDFEANLQLMNIALKEVEKKKYRAKDIIGQMKKEGFKTINMHTFVTFWRSVDGKNPKHALGTDIAGTWYWYASMIDRFRQHLQKDVAKLP